MANRLHGTVADPCLDRRIWGHATRTQLVAGMSTLILLPLALIPLIIVLPHLYSWLRPDVATHLANSFYLNLPAFVARSIFYLIVWFGLAWSILRALRLGEHESALERIAPVGLILLALTVTFAAIDTTMSLDPHFSSSVYGLIAIAEMGLLALAVSILGVAVGGPSDSKALRDLGRLLLALLILWAYLDFVQLLIVWQSDLPNEAAWYRRPFKRGVGLCRGAGRWNPFRAALFRFVGALGATIVARDGRRYGSADIGRDHTQLVAGGAAILDKLWLC